MHAASDEPTPRPPAQNLRDDFPSRPPADRPRGDLPDPAERLDPGDPPRRRFLATSLKLLVYVAPVIETFRATRLHAESMAGSAASLLAPPGPPQAEFPAAGDRKRGLAQVSPLQ